MEHHYCFCKKFGFTLAEVLITLAVIGIVAVLTIPGMIKKHNQRVLHTSFLRSLSVFNNATKMALNEYGVETTKYMSADEFNNQFLPVFLKNLKVTGEEQFDRYVGGHYIQTYSGKSNTVYNTANSCFTTSKPNTTLKYYILNDGQLFCFRSLGNWRGAYNTITFDSNGLKGPNRYGYDVFEFNIFNTLQPYSENGSKLYCSESSDHISNGRFCAYWALKDVNPEDNTQKYWDSLKF